LPTAERQMVGPFIFLDHFGPAEMISSEKFDVRPHPHIGLATVTYLYEGEMCIAIRSAACRRSNPGT
jgi:redox-sensitive bicupin YhaK (pirin superfamily)